MTLPSPSRALAPAALLLALIGAAHAEQRGLVVRLEAGGETVTGAVKVTLTATGGGEGTEIELKDDGTPPDVTAGDGTYSGSSWMEGDDFTVSVQMGDKKLDGGAVSWKADDLARDLSVSVKGDSVSVETGSGPGGGAGGGNQDPNAAPGTAPGAPGGDPGGANATGQPTAPPDPGASSPTGVSGPPVARGTSGKPVDGTLYIGFGLGLLVLVGIAWLWLRNRPAQGSTRGGGLAVVPEPGILGDGTPSLSDGLMVWVAGAEDASALARPLAATLARHHRVLFVGKAGVNAPSVYGGPVYRTANARPSHVGDAAETLQGEGGAPVAVLITGAEPDATVHKDYADLLPTGVGGVSIVTADPGVTAVARVTARRDGPVWVIQAGDRTLRMVEGPAGFVDENAR